MSNADLIKRLRSQNFKDLGSITAAMHEAADALEQCERKCAEQAHEISTMKLIIRKMEGRRK